MTDTDQELNDRFASQGPALPADVLSELVHLLRLFSLDVQDLFYKWESYVQKMGAESTHLTLKTVKDFKKDIQEALERDSRAANQNAQQSARKIAATPRAAVGGDDVFGMLDGMATATPGPRTTSTIKRKVNNFDTPVSKSARNDLNSSPSEHKASFAAGAHTIASFEKRNNAGRVEETLNQHLPAAVKPAEPFTEARVKLKANADLQKFAYRPMAMKLSESSEILDDRIDQFTDLVQQHHGLPDTAFGNPAAQSTAEIVAVGRIACDQPNGRLNAASVVLETSRRMGAGMRVPLKIQGIGYDLFPGKIVAVRGSNVSGEYFTVSEILSMPLIEFTGSSPSDLDIHRDRLSGSQGEITPLSMLVGSGPYTMDTDLSFAPLQVLLSKAEEQRSDVLILTGPFLDLEHPIIASGDLEDHLPPDANIQPDRATLNDVFRALISRPIQNLVQAVSTITIILVPSMRDAISKHVAWPQDKFPKQALGLPKQVYVVTNPIVLSINEMTVGISTQDVLSELRRENVHQAGQGQAFSDDLLARLCSSVIEQRHFFPVFPPQARENLPKPTAISGEIPEPGEEERYAMGANIDIAYYKLGEWLTFRPDLLIMPSMLNPFAKVVNGVTCINPGTLSKKRGAGTYAALSVHARELTDQEREEEFVAHDVPSRTRVDVTRI